MASGFTTTTSLAELIPEITLGVDYIFQNRAIGRLLATVKDISGQPGVTVEFPRFTEVAASTSVAETATPTSHQMDITMPTLTVARRSVYVGLGDLARASATAGPADIGEAMGMAMAKAVDTLIFGVLVATTNWTTGTGATNAGLTITNVLDGLNLLENNEIEGPIYCVVHPVQYKNIRNALTPVANDDAIAVGIADEVARNAFVSRAFGVDWFITNRISQGTVGTTGSLYNGLLFHRRGIGYAFKWMFEAGVEAERDAANAVTKLVLNWADSAGVIYDSAVCKLYST